MLKKINQSLLNIFSSSNVNKLLLVCGVFITILWLFINELAPLLGAVLIAYILQGAVTKLEKSFKLSRTAAVTNVIACFMFIAAIAAYALPKFLLQLRELGDKTPQTGKILEAIVEKINHLLPAGAGMDQEFIGTKSTEFATSAASYLFNNLLGYAGNLFSLVIYMILLPMLVFFLLRDKEYISSYLRQFLPASPIFADLWQRIDNQFGSYIRGKILEAVLVGVSTWIVFLLFKMEYALALAILVGLSVLVPFVGVIAVTFPVVLFAYLQFGWSATFGWIIGIYTVIQIVDGQILVPLLFSSVINIHPVALFSALIFFGNLWGIWGVFFAIPLAALIKSIITVIINHHREAQ